jgi:hypothetical protein
MLEGFPLEISQHLICLVGSIGMRIVMQEQQWEVLEYPDDEAVEREVTAWFRQQPKEFYAAGFPGLVNDGRSASMYREIMLRNKSIFHISTLICLSSISICNLLTDLPLYLLNHDFL